MIYVIDDVVTPSIADRMERDIAPSLFYQYNKKTSYVPDVIKTYNDSNTYDIGQLVSPVYFDGTDSFPSSPHYYLMEFILLSCLDKVGLSFAKMRRIKVNMLLRQDFPESHYNIPHVDSLDGFSLIYYINDSDGDTFLFNEIKYYRENNVPPSLKIIKRVTPKKNRAVLFNSNRMHASSNPRVSEQRYVINFTFDLKGVYNNSFL